MTNPVDINYAIGDRVALAYYMRNDSIYPIQSWRRHVGQVSHFGICEALVYYWNHDEDRNVSDFVELMTNSGEVQPNAVERYETDRRFSVNINQRAVNDKQTVLDAFIAANNITGDEVKQMLSEFYFPQVVVPQSYNRMCMDLSAITGSNVSIPRATIDVVVEQARSLGMRTFCLPDNYIRTRFNLTSTNAEQEANF